MAGLEDYEGQYVVLSTADDQIFQGILCSLDENTGKIVLKNASTKGFKLPGVQNFFVSNIKELSLTKPNGLRVPRTSDNLPNGRQRCSKSFYLRRNKHRHTHLKGLLRFDSDLLVRPQCTGDDSVDQGIGSGEDNESFEDFYEEEDYTMFCQTCEKFRDSITYLMKQKMIAVTFHGADIGRKGTLSLIQIATGNSVLLYDVLRLGNEGFVDGLQAVLESNGVLKIIHDCRMISDLLYHQFDVSLSNVFDTQVAAVFIFRSSNHGDWPRFVESLPGILMTHMGLKNEEIHQFFVRERLKQKDEEVWLQRPLCCQLIQDSLKNLVHMISLYHNLQAKMMKEFHIAIQLYLDQVRNAPKDKVDIFRSFSHLLPFVFQDLPKLSTHCLTQNPRNASLSHIKPLYDSRGFRDVCPKMGSGMVTFSKDSIWHRKSYFCKASCQCGSKSSMKMTGDDESINKFKTNKPHHESESEREQQKHQDSIQHSMASESISGLKYVAESIGDVTDDNFNIHHQISSLDIDKSDAKATCLDVLSPDSVCVNSKLLAKPSSSSSSSSSFHSKQSSFTSRNQKLESKCVHLSTSEVKDKHGSKLSTPSVHQTFDNNNNNNTYNEIPRAHRSAIERSALLRLDSHCPTSPSSFPESQLSDRTSNHSSDNLNDVDVDKLYEFDMVQKILKKARLGHSKVKSEAKSRLLPSKSKISPKARPLNS